MKPRFRARREYFVPLGWVKVSGQVRNVVLKEYVGQDHAGGGECDCG